MNTSSHIGSFLLGAALLGIAGCAPAADDERGEQRVQSADLAAGTELQVKAPGITVWVDPVAHPTERFGQPAWTIDLRTSKNLERVFSFMGDDELGEAVQTSARKAQVWLDASQLTAVLGGRRLIVDLDAATGSQRQYFISVVVGTKLERFHGSSKLTLRKTITPFLYGGETRYRNLVGVATGWGDLSVTTDEPGAGPLAIGATGAQTPVDWSAAALLGVAADPEAELHVSATNGVSTVTRSGGVDVTVSGLQITTSDDPLEVWPEPTCSASAQACITALPADELDTSSCGTAAQVRRCKRPIPEADLPTKAVFAEHLSNTMFSWYERHGDEIAAAGGNTREQAQAAISADKVQQVTDPSEDPHAHDLSKFLIYRHPDMIFPGSDVAWFGAYDRASGALFEIYDFN